MSVLNYKDNLERAREYTMNNRSKFAAPVAAEQVQKVQEGLMRPIARPEPKETSGGTVGGIGLAVMEGLRSSKQERKEERYNETYGQSYNANGGGSSTVPDSKTAARIRGKLIDRGLPPHVADAFIVNFQDESGLNSGINEANPIVEGSRGGFGLAQWTGPRRVAYEAYAKQKGVNPSDEDAQLDFAIMELYGSEKKAGDAIFKTNNTSDAAVAILNKFLRPAKKHAESRTASYRNL